MEKIILFESFTEAIGIIGDREIRRIRVGQSEYGLARLKNEFFIFETACPHMEYDLTTGKISPAGTVVCPWHNYQFFLNSGKEMEGRCKSLLIKEVFTDQNGNLCFQAF